MAQCLKVRSESASFIFDDEDNLNIFNLLRLVRDFSRENEISIDISTLEQKYQLTIASKFSNFLELYSAIVRPTQEIAYLVFSNIEQSFIESLNKNQKFIHEDNILIFEIDDANPKINNPQDPHYVKNARGVALLSLVQDLLAHGSLQKNFSIFNEKSPILLHSASIFLYNEENSKMIWKILEEWNGQDINQYKSTINQRIARSREARINLDVALKDATWQLLNNRTFKVFVNLLESKFDLPTSIYSSTGKLNLWLVDDQHANGWLKLISNIVSDTYIEITTLSDKEDVSLHVKFITTRDNLEAPDIAIVDLRLSHNDDGIEGYNAQDLSGFEVVDLLKSKWSSLSIMIASASSKLWNMEKAIAKGAVAYWRKSDEVSDNAYQSAVLTAFDIHFQLLEKITISVNRTRFKFIFRIVDALKINASFLDSRYSSLQRIIENYFNDLEQKTSWACWHKCNNEKINDSIYLGIAEIFNEIEDHLWEPDTYTFTLVPNKKVQARKNNTDKLIINDTLEFMDLKYNITGIALRERYERYKRIRNKLPIIHGSKAVNDIKHADIIDIESALLIVWCLLYELQLRR